MYKLTGVTKEYLKDRGVVNALRGVDQGIEDGEWPAGAALAARRARDPCPSGEP